MGPPLSSADTLAVVVNVTPVLLAAFIDRGHFLSRECAAPQRRVIDAALEEAPTKHCAGAKRERILLAGASAAFVGRHLLAIPP